MLLTVKCQSWPLLLSQVPLPLWKTQSNWVVLAVMVTVLSQRLEAELNDMAASGETTGFQLFQPRWMKMELALANGPPAGENAIVALAPAAGGTGETHTRPLQPFVSPPPVPPRFAPTQTCWIGELQALPPLSTPRR